MNNPSFELWVESFGQCFERARYEAAKAGWDVCAEAMRVRCAECDCGDGECNWMPNSRDTIARLELKIGNLEAQELQLRRRLTDQQYMLDAYRKMLGPKGLSVDAIWRARNVKRVHFDWSPEAASLTGEGRAQLILEWDKAPRRPMTLDEEAGL